MHSQYLALYTAKLAKQYQIERLGKMGHARESDVRKITLLKSWKKEPFYFIK